MQIPIRELWQGERSSLAEHFLSLKSEDRRLRFGTPLGDASVREYVRRIEFEQDALFGVFDEELRLLGVAHVSRAAGHAELGISVLEACRKRGIGGALLSRAHLRARNWGMSSLFMHCLTENAAMMRLALRRGMRVAREAGEADAWLRLSPADAGSHFGELFEQRAAVFDYALKSLTRGISSRAPGR